MEENKPKSKKFVFIFAFLIVVGGSYGVYKYLHGSQHEETDDAQIEKNMNPIIPKVGGYITKVYVSDNQFVKKGDTLFTIDKQDYALKVADAQAALVAAQETYSISKTDVAGVLATVEASEANVASGGGSIENAKIRLERTTNDFNRYQNLFKNRSITKQQFEQALAAKQEAENQLQILQQQQRANNFQKNAIVAKSKASSQQIEVAATQIQRAKALLETAKLNLGYTVVCAAVNGQISRVALQPGQLIQPGQALFYIINDDETWVTANFKETQLNRMQMGQKVIVKVDAFPDTDFEGKITSFSPATGAKFSLLPPDNATGNFVKTIQRLPVKINFTNLSQLDKIKKLRSGMNAEVDVFLKE